MIIFPMQLKPAFEFKPPLTLIALKCFGFMCMNYMIIIAPFIIEGFTAMHTF